jgi:hypothetical protein
MSWAIIRTVRYAGRRQQRRSMPLATTRHKVNLAYTREELLALFDAASREDVDNGGRYDRRFGAIHVWSHRWINAATRHDSETIGAFYVSWIEERLYHIECAEGFDLTDLLHELALLETKALGRIKHGRRTDTSR